MFLVFFVAMGAMVEGKVATTTTADEDEDEEYDAGDWEEYAEGDKEGEIDGGLKVFGKNDEGEDYDLASLGIDEEDIKRQLAEMGLSMDVSTLPIYVCIR
jgi:hypothetical protein